MFKIRSSIDRGGLIARIKETRREMREAKKLGDMVVINTAKNVYATNPEDRIYYYKAVDEGRRAVFPRPEGQGAKDKKLHYKVSESEWVVAPYSRESEPARITDVAAPLAQRTINAESREFFAGLRKPATARDIKVLRQRLRRRIAAIYKQATLDQTTEYDVQAQWYGANETLPLALSFRVITERAYRQQKFDEEVEF